MYQKPQESIVSDYGFCEYQCLHSQNLILKKYSISYTNIFIICVVLVSFALKDLSVCCSLAFPQFIFLLITNLSPLSSKSTFLNLLVNPGAETVQIYHFSVCQLPPTQSSAQRRGRGGSGNLVLQSASCGLPSLAHLSSSRPFLGQKHNSVLSFSQSSRTSLNTLYSDTNLS